MYFYYRCLIIYTGHCHMLYYHRRISLAEIGNHPKDYENNFKLK